MFTITIVCIPDSMLSDHLGARSLYDSNDFEDVSFAFWDAFQLELSTLQVDKKYKFFSDAVYMNTPYTQATWATKTTLPNGADLALEIVVRQAIQDALSKAVRAADDQIERITNQQKENA